MPTTNAILPADVERLNDRIAALDEEDENESTAVFTAGSGGPVVSLPAATGDPVCLAVVEDLAEDGDGHGLAQGGVGDGQGNFDRG